MQRHAAQDVCAKALSGTDTPVTERISENTVISLTFFRMNIPSHSWRAAHSNSPLTDPYHVALTSPRHRPNSMLTISVREMLRSGLIDFRTSDGVDESGTLVSLEAMKLNEGVHLLVPVHL